MLRDSKGVNFYVYLDLYAFLQKALGRRIAIKGNVLLTTILPSLARMTEDLDTSVFSEKDYDEKVVPALKVFGDECVRRGLGDYYIIREISAKRSGGIIVKRYNPIPNQGDFTEYSVDVSLNSKLVMDYSQHYNIDCDLAFCGSSIEKIMADKTRVVLSKGRCRRSKDFYDLYIILVSNVNFDMNRIKLIIEDEKKVSNVFSEYPFVRDAEEQMRKAWNKLEIRNYEGGDLNKPDFEEVIRVLKIYLDRLYSLY